MPLVPPLCHDCRANLRQCQEDRYELTPATRRMAGLADGQIACLRCLEARLMRALVPSDFTLAVVNRVTWGKSERLMGCQGLKKTAA